MALLWQQKHSLQWLYTVSVTAFTVQCTVHPPSASKKVQVQSLWRAERNRRPALLSWRRGGGYAWFVLWWDGPHCLPGRVCSAASFLQFRLLADVQVQLQVQPSCQNQCKCLCLSTRTAPPSALLHENKYSLSLWKSVQYVASTGPRSYSTA